MKQNLLKSVATVAMSLLALGCTKRSVNVSDAAEGQEVSVTFAAEIPGLQTKTIGDGTTAKNLTVAVYESDTEGKPAAHITSLDKHATFTALKTTVNFQLVKGKTYHFIFWAQAEGAPYTFNAETKEVAIDYSGSANDESRDAFYTTKTLRVVGSATETIQLYRPFAQVNFGTADLAAAIAAGVTPTLSTLTATDAATILDLFAGEGKGEADITYTAAAIPTEMLTLKDGSTYDYLAMNYFIPVGKLSESHISNFIATFKGASDDVVVNVPSAPVQANWRTNIVGKLLTDNLVFNIEIVPAFEE